MKKLTTYLGLTICLIALLSGILTLSGQNMVKAIGINYISVDTPILDLASVQMGLSFNTGFNVIASNASNDNPASVYINGLTANPSYLYIISSNPYFVQLSGTVPQTYGPFSFDTTVSGPYNTQLVTVKGVALYPAPTGITAVYDSANAQLHFHCNPVPGAAKYKLVIKKKSLIPSLIFREITSNDAIIDITLSSSYRYSVGVAAVNADDSLRSVLSNPFIYITVQ